MKNPVFNRVRLRQLITSTSLYIFTLLAFVACNSSQKSENKPKELSFDPDKWLTVEETSLGFKAKFPGKWKSNIQFMDTGRGMATVYIFEYWHIAFQYGITIVRLPEGVADTNNTTKALDNAVLSLAEKQNAIVSYQQPITVGGCPARRAVLTLPDSYLKNARVNTIIVLRDNLVYRITTAGIGNLEYVDFFLKSFELVPMKL